ncbi:delta-60 repeat domain-containing protein [Haloferula sp. BvORR071]|uniref:delta-60 repeat domain-containing protein n=1 Tax=Haloferula sp. BvORR071 TaxID=1396141 RepID=UPI000558CFC3|nr:delta-60 repeat domain-containing protein [Haloferula sp. BvORR071]
MKPVPALPPAARALWRAFLYLWLAALSSAQAQTSTQIADLRIRGDIRAIQPMPDSSFVLGGITNYYNGTRETQLLRIQSNGTRVAFPVTTNSAVTTMVHAAPWLYLGGGFTVVNNTSCPFVARVNDTTGAVDATWRPAPNGDVISLAMVPGQGLFISGAFSDVGGLPRQQLALVSTTGTGKPDSLWKCDANGQVDRIIAANGWLHIAGRFTQLGGTTVSYLGRASLSSGAADNTWRPAPNFQVYDIALDATHVYFGGSFTQVGASSTKFLARANLTNGTSDSNWKPQPDRLITRLALADSAIYAAGDFRNMAAANGVREIARVLKTGAVDVSFVPQIEGAVMAIVPDGAQGVWAGGRFDSGALAGSGFAQFPQALGSAAPTYPGEIEAAGKVLVMKLETGGGSWIVGGDFDRVNGTTRRAAFRLSTAGVIDSTWNPNLKGNYPMVTGADNFTASSDLLLAGQFEMPDGLYNCIRVNSTTGIWNPSFHPQPDNLVSCLMKHGTGWMIGGNFKFVDGFTRPNLTRFDATGAIDGTFEPLPDGAVHSLLEIDGEVYVGGEFNTFGEGQNLRVAPYLARLIGNAPDIAWQPRPNQAVFSLANDGNFIFAGGRFTRMARTPRANLAQLPLGGAGTATAWNPAPNNAVNILRINNGALYVGGAFDTIANFVWRRIARFPLPSLALDTSFQSTAEDGEVTSIVSDTGTGLMVGGSFTGWDNVFTKRGLIKISPSGGGPSLLTMPPPPPEETSDLYLAYFGSGTNWLCPAQPLPPVEGPGIEWTESQVEGRPVARVQWSTDLQQWHESGDTADGITRMITIEAQGDLRIARITPAPQHVYFRLILTAGEPPAALPQ